MLWLFNEPDVFGDRRVFDSVFTQARPLPTPKLRSRSEIVCSPDVAQSTGEIVLSTDVASASSALPIASNRRRK